MSQGIEEPRRAAERLFKESNLYSSKRLIIYAIVAAAITAMLVAVGMWTGGMLVGGSLLGYVGKKLKEYLLKRHATPERLILFLRPFGARPNFDILPALLTAAAPFGRVVALLRDGDRDGGEYAIVQPTMGELDHANDIALKIRNKDVALKYGTLLKSSDSEWKRVIETWIVQANIVVVDAGSIGLGLAWEIETVSSRFGPDEVIFCVPSPAEVSSASEPDSPVDRLAAILGDWHPRIRRIIQYPPTSPPVNAYFAVNEVSQRIVTQVVECLGRLERSHIFCGECGRRIGSEATSCPACGTRSWKVELRGRRDIFCGECGKVMKPEVIHCTRCGTRSWRVKEQNDRTLEMPR